MGYKKIDEAIAYINSNLGRLPFIFAVLIKHFNSKFYSTPMLVVYVLTMLHFMLSMTIYLLAVLVHQVWGNIMAVRVSKPSHMVKRYFHEDELVWDHYCSHRLAKKFINLSISYLFVSHLAIEITTTIYF